MSVHCIDTKTIRLNTYSKMSHLSIEYLKENKCASKECYNFRLKGYILCAACLYGIEKMDDEDIKRLENV